MGEVWRAVDTLTDTECAIKVLRDDLVGDKHFLDRLEIEAANARRMSHQNLAAVLDSGQDGSTGWLVMELVSGRPLTDYLDDGRTLSEVQLLPILYQCALALTAVHTANVVHRDVKPGNILIADDGLVKLTDFGISRFESQVDLTAAGMVMGTAQYLPPEQAKGQPATALGDIYSLGIIAYEALAGKRPFTGTTQVDIAIAHVNQKVPPLPDSVPPLVRTLIMSMLQKKPVNRPPDAASFARQVAYVARQLEISIDPCPLGDPPPAPAAQVEPTACVPVIEPKVSEESLSSVPPVSSSAAANSTEIPLPPPAQVTPVVPAPPPAPVPSPPPVPEVPNPSSSPAPVAAPLLSEDELEGEADNNSVPSSSVWADTPKSFTEIITPSSEKSSESLEDTDFSPKHLPSRQGWKEWIGLEKGSSYLLVRDAPVSLLVALLLVLLVVSFLIQIIFVSAGTVSAAPLLEGSSWLIQVLVV
ncbi:serine/threonine protein kinase [Actinomycetaceae bacterium TAE3-ERU4]|nr:serine/threonine protein kinase [Actinomycetaceae bacterium TAE3-ERU4]